jgi:hypothetical protein
VLSGYVAWLVGGYNTHQANQQATRQGYNLSVCVDWLQKLVEKMLNIDISGGLVRDYLTTADPSGATQRMLEVCVCVPAPAQQRHPTALCNAVSSCCTWACLASAVTCEVGPV